MNESRNGRVIVVGSVNVDLVVTVERLPARGETVLGGAFRQHRGGKGGNQAVAAARLGARTFVIGAVGDDAFGADARAALELEGIDTSELVAVDDAPTGVALILVDAGGENSIAVAGGANRRLSPSMVRAALERLRPGPADVLLVGHEITTAAAAAALATGRAGGAMTILNPAPAPGLDAATIGLADLVTPNEGELADLSARAVVPRAMLVSLGAAGARLATPDIEIEIPGPVVSVVDTVGAGDTLNGALAAGLAEGRSVADAARRAVAAASFAVTRAGAREGMPTRAELERVLKPR